MIDDFRARGAIFEGVQDEEENNVLSLPKDDLVATSSQPEC